MGHVNFKETTDKNPSFYRFKLSDLLLVVNYWFILKKIHPPLNNCELSLIRINDKLLRYHLNWSDDMILHNFIQTYSHQYIIP